MNEKKCCFFLHDVSRYVQSSICREMSVLSLTQVLAGWVNYLFDDPRSTSCRDCNMALLCVGGRTNGHSQAQKTRAGSLRCTMKVANATSRKWKIKRREIKEVPSQRNPLVPEQLLDKRGEFFHKSRTCYVRECGGPNCGNNGFY